MNPALLPLLGFAAGALAVAGAYSLLSDLFLRDRSRVNQRVDEEFRKRQRDQARRSTLFGDLAALAPGEATAAEENPGLRRRFQELVDQSGLNLTPQRLLAIMAAFSLGLGAVGGALRQSLIVGILGALVGGALPLLYVAQKRRARLQKMLSQLPDALELMARIIRAGQTTSQAIQAVSDEFDQPIAGEFNYCYEQQNLGLPPEAAYRDLARRTGILEIKIFILGLLVQQQAGGNLAELLEKLSGVIRERFKISGKIAALTAEGRMQAAVLLGLPPAMLVIMGVTSPDYIRVHLDYSYLLIGALALELVGAVWIRKIVNFDY
ncbi:MAG: type II secretion system F family protein [Gemmataceae bacterium]